MCGIPSGDRNTPCGRGVSQSGVRMLVVGVRTADSGNAGSLASMGKRQPIGKLSRGLVGSGPVERHHCCRDPRRSQELGAPTVADMQNLDEIRTPANCLFEAMNGHSIDA